MSLKALPIQFLNLGGEMMYIIDQRLRAQEILQDRADKVRNDILSIMLNQRFVEELFHPQPIYSKAALRTVFDKLAHGSIMRLNASSMDKLFDLMVMAFKHQLLLCPQPSDLIFLTLNHLDAMRSFAATPEVKDQVLVAQQHIMKLHKNLSVGDWDDIRRALLMFVQDFHIRVSIFLKTGAQDHLGKIVLPTSGSLPFGTDVPGTIRFFDSGGDVSLVTLFPSGGNYTYLGERGSLEITGNRGTSLGLNMYDEREDTTTMMQNSTMEENIGSYFNKRHSLHEVPGRGKEELNLLAQLIGSVSQPAENKEFKLQLFQNEEEEEEEDREFSSDKVITIEAANRANRPELGEILGQLNIDEPDNEDGDENDLLQLIDSL